MSSEMCNWKIYYADGTVFSSYDGSPWCAPGLGVLVIVLLDDNHGWITQSGEDYYVWDCRGGETRWWGMNEVGFWEYMFTQPGYKCALMGTRTSNVHFDEIYKKASEDPNFPAKTSFANKERKA